MATTSSDAARIAVNNVRVPHEEFLTIWNEASRREAELAGDDVTDWYVGAVVQTCR